MKTPLFTAPTLAVMAGLAHLATTLADSPAAFAPPPLAELAAQLCAAAGPGSAPSVSWETGGARLVAGFQKLEARVDATGLRLQSTEDGGGVLALGAVSLGRSGGGEKRLASRGEVTADGDRVLFARPGLVEEYSASLEGVRQDFLVLERPAGEGWLKVGLRLRGARARAAEPGVVLTLDGSGRELAYHRLHVVDARGRVLEARLEARAADCLEVSVDDSLAAYPVRIDPTFSDLDWTSLNQGLAGANLLVAAAAVDSGGRLYVGGYFTFIGSVAASRVACWDGSTWTALGSGLNGYVHSLTVLGTDLYAGGDFTEAGGAPAARVARWDGTSWSALGSGMDAPVEALGVAGGSLYAGGSFSTAGGVPAARVARWDGSAWHALGSGADATVRALHSVGPDLYAGGSFSTAGGVPAAFIARWDGAAWSAVGGGMDGTVSALASGGGRIYAGGHFQNAGGVAAQRIAAWDGASWEPLGDGVLSAVRCLAVRDGEVFAGGDFTLLGGGAGTARHIARWDGSQWQALDSGMNTGGAVSALAFVGADLFAGGQFTTAGGLPAERLARWNGTAWNSTGAAGINGVVRALALHGGEIYAGGSFTTAGGGQAGRIARWDGADWHPLGAGLDGDVHALLSLGGHLYAGGAFTTAGGAPAARMARWDGTAWSALGTGLNGTVHALAALGGQVHAGGAFTASGGTTLNRVARWDGTVWSALGSGMNERVNALAVSGTNLYAGGDFTTAGEGSAARVARWDGSAWQALGGGMNAPVLALAASSTEVFAGGDFNTADSAPAGYIARWSGGAWHPLGGGVNGPVHALAITGAGLHVGGHLTTAGGAAAQSVAKWSGSAWLPLGSGASGLVRALAVAGGELYAGGDFITVGAGLASPFVAKAALPAGMPAIQVEQPLLAPLTAGVSTVAFGTVSVGASSAAFTFTVRNAGSADLGPLSVSVLPGADAADFSLDVSGMNGTLAAGADTAFTLAFAPSISGARTAQLRVSSNDPLLPDFDVTLSGTGVAVGAPHIEVSGGGVVIAPGDLLPGTANLTDYGFVQVLDTQARRTFAITNSGAAPLTLHGVPRVLLGGPDAADFRVIQEPAATVAEGAVTQFQIQFDPSLPGWRGATVSISSNDPGTPVHTFAIGGYARLPLPLAQSIVLTPPGTLHAGQGGVTLLARATSGLPVLLTLLSGPATLSGHVLTPTGPGTVRVQATQPGDGLYAAARAVVLSIQVKAMPSAPVLVDLVWRYDGTAKAARVVNNTAGALLSYQGSAGWSMTAPSRAGRHPVRAEVDGRLLKGVLVIEKAPLILRAHDQRKFTGQNNPALTFDFEGLASGDTADSALTRQPDIKTTATRASPGGAYPITTSGGAAADYTLVHQRGTLVVESFSGAYEALLLDGSAQVAGRLSVLAAKSDAAFTGILLTASESAPIRLSGGVFPNVSSASATAQATSTAGGAAYSVTCVLHLDGRMTATVTRDGAAHASATDGVKLLSLPKGARTTHAGAHTLILEPATPAGATVPAGGGWASGIVSPAGVLTLSGRLADGTVFTTALAADRMDDPGHRLFVQPYRPARAQSFLGGAFQLLPHPVLAGQRYAPAAALVWKKAGLNADPAYRTGFGPVETVLILDPWRKPSASAPLPALLGLDAGQISVQHSATGSDSHAALPTKLFLDARGTASVLLPLTTPPNSTRWKIAFKAATGAFSGSFELRDGPAKRTASFTGILRQPHDPADTLIGSSHFLQSALPGAPTNERLSGEVLLQR